MSDVLNSRVDNFNGHKGSDNPEQFNAFFQNLTDQSTQADKLGQLLLDAASPAGPAPITSATVGQKLPEFPLAAFPNEYQILAKELRQTKGFPVEFTLAAVITAHAAAIAGRVQLDAPRWGHVQPIIWQALVGPQGMNKTHPIQHVLRPIFNHDQVITTKWKDDRSHVLATRATTSQPLPPQKALVVMNSTTEGLLARLQHNPGLLWLHDELKGMFTGMNQYKGGRGNDEEILLSLFNGSYTKTNKVDEGQNMHAAKPCVPIIGTIQPATLGIFAQNGRDSNGIVPRFLYTFAEPFLHHMSDDGAKVDVFPPDAEHYNRIDKLLTYHTGQPDLFTYHITDAARSLYYDMQNALGTAKFDVIGIDHEAGTLAKLSSYLPRLALVMHCMNGNDYLQKGIGADALNRAWQLVQYYRQTAALVFDQATKRDQKQLIAQVKAMTAAGVPQTKQAEILGVDQATISRWNRK